MVSITVQLLSVSPTLNPRYSFTNQNPPSFTCDKITDPAPIAMTSNSRLMPGVAAAKGATMPAAVVIATVADPVATRITAATSQPKTSGETGARCANCAIASPTPLATKTLLKPPPAPTTSSIEAM